MDFDLGIDAACIVGHGMGGAIAQAIALNAPSRVTRLCLVNSTAFDAWPRGAARLARMLAAVPALGRAAGAPLLAGLVHRVYVLKGFADEENGRHVLDNYLRAYTMRLGVDALISQLRAMHDATAAAIGARLKQAIVQPIVDRRARAIHGSACAWESDFATRSPARRSTSLRRLDTFPRKMHPPASRPRWQRSSEAAVERLTSALRPISLHYRCGTSVTFLLDCPTHAYAVLFRLLTSLLRPLRETLLVVAVLVATPPARCVHAVLSPAPIPEQLASLTGSVTDSIRAGPLVGALRHRRRHRATRDDRRQRQISH